MSARYGLALRAYPVDYRASHGDELVDTANELAGGAWSFRQSRSQLAGGLRTRARLSADGSPRQLWAQGVGLALALWFLIGTVGPLTWLLGARGGLVAIEPKPWFALAIIGVPLVGLTITTRWPTALLVTGSAVASPIAVAAGLDGSNVEGFAIRPLAITTTSAAVTLVLTWWLAIRTDGRRALSAAATAALLAILVAVGWATDAPFGPAPLALLLGLPVVGLVLAAFDPRPAIAATALWLLLAATQVPAVALWINEDGLSSETATALGVPILILLVGFAVGRAGTRRVLDVART